jgi:hypothetical protein
MSEDKSMATRLRAEGYVPLPRWWVKPEDVDVVRRIVGHHAQEVYRIKSEVRLEREMQDYAGSNRHGWGDEGRGWEDE